jgi:hypothetical protein
MFHAMWLGEVTIRHRQALNCCGPSDATNADDGETEIVGSFMGGGLMPLLPHPEVQPIRSTANDT